LRGLKQADLAERTGLKQSAISHFECGRRLPSMKNLVRLADALECSADLFYGDIVGEEETECEASPEAQR
jgi:transcriptional regulator with XRE-family HTH domain